MTNSVFSLDSKIAPILYVLVALPLILLQHLTVVIVFDQAGIPLEFDGQFWFFPIERLASMADVGSGASIAGFAVCLIVGALLCLLSFQRANWAGRGHGLALLAMVPTIQIFAALALALLPRRTGEIAAGAVFNPASNRQIATGLIAGMTIIVLGVAVSASTFGAYGWGLFVMTPFLVGVTTGYAVNYGAPRSLGSTYKLVALAGVLGSLALLMLALEGLLCIVLIVPLAGVLAMLGGLFGRAAAIRMRGHGGPLFSLAALPFIFMIDAAMPPSLAIDSRQSIEIDAPADAVWRALTSDQAIETDGGIVGLAGLAYPVASHLTGDGVGSRRIGQFSTGAADERVTIWERNRTLAFRVVRQPPAMEEMSPYRRVHAPHVNGYFDTGETRFDLTAKPDGGTRLTISAGHVLRIDPVLYWGPIARWAIDQNLRRVLGDVRIKAERAGR